MCKSGTCSTCTGKTWWGCGKHIPAVLDHVPKSEWCTCEPKVQTDGTGQEYPPKADKADADSPLYLEVIDKERAD